MKFPIGIILLFLCCQGCDIIFPGPPSPQGSRNGDPQRYYKELFNVWQLKYFTRSYEDIEGVPIPDKLETYNNVDMSIKFKDTRIQRLEVTYGEYEINVSSDNAQWEKLKPLFFQYQGEFELYNGNTQLLYLYRVWKLTNNGKELTLSVDEFLQEGSRKYWRITTLYFY